MNDVTAYSTAPETTYGGKRHKYQQDTKAPNERGEGFNKIKITSGTEVSLMNT